MDVTAFHRAGFAALSDLRAPGYDAIFEKLEATQIDFNAQAPTFRDPAYQWGPGETLRTWARAWEYAYVSYHVGRECAARNGAIDVADFGSGSTFFPFAIARLGANVVCLDNDPICVTDMTGAARALDTGSGSVRVLQSGTTLPLADASIDVAYSVSVLEHMPDPVPIITELARIVKPGGAFVLTLDLDFEGGASGVSVPHFYALMDHLRVRFDWKYADHTVPPLDILTSKNSPWPRPGERNVPGLLWRTKERRYLPLIGGPDPGILTVYGCTLQRRAS